MMINTRIATAVREPTPDELKNFRNLSDVLTWAIVKGDPSWEHTQAGSLLHLLAGDEFTTMEGEEFASIIPADFEDAVAAWKFSIFDGDYGHGRPDITERLLPSVRTRARVAHRAAQLWKHFEWSSQAVTAYKQWQDVEAVTVRGVNAVQQTTIAAPSGDMVRMHETVDVTKIREVPMMESRDWEKGLDFLKLFVHKFFFPVEQPSLAQMTALLKIFRCGGCYVVFLFFGVITTSALQSHSGAEDWSSGQEASSSTNSSKDRRTSGIGPHVGMYPMWNDLRSCMHPASLDRIPHADQALREYLR